MQYLKLQTGHTHTYCIRMLHAITVASYEESLTGPFCGEFAWVCILPKSKHMHALATNLSLGVRIRASCVCSSYHPRAHVASRIMAPEQQSNCDCLLLALCSLGALSVNLDLNKSFVSWRVFEALCHCGAPICDSDELPAPFIWPDKRNN